MRIQDYKCFQASSLFRTRESGSGEAALKRDFPVMFGTLYFFTLLGLAMGIIGDIMYHVIDPRIDFEAREV
jgi:ABC-type microcin C transport system permease subunit YejB